MYFSHDKRALHSRAKLTLIASKKSWIEGKAIEQLEKTAQLEGMKLAVGLPDLHPGRGFPIGAAFLTKNLIYPALAGNDIGCGIALFQTDLVIRKLRLDKAVRKLDGLDEGPFDDLDEPDLVAFRDEFELERTDHDTALGTIGGGNHFSELTGVDEIFEPEMFAALGLEKDCCQLLAHSGSRGLGQAILQRTLREHGAAALHEDSEEAREYFKHHDHAVAWSVANRALIARRFAGKIGASVDSPALDISHNLISPVDWQGVRHFVHRKGAADSLSGAVMVPGSRGSLSFLVMPVGDGCDNAFSLAHGAGRRWQRGMVKSRLSHKFKPDELKNPPTGGRVICESRELLYDEAPQAYKNINEVIDDMQQAGMIKLIASFKPLITYKTRRRS